jgi:RNA methyltransferase, TrmH family
MISKSKAKYIKSLQVKKYRKQEQSFVVEGAKGVEELLRSDFKTTMVFASAAFLDEHEDLLRSRGIEVAEATASELEAVGSVESNESALAVGQMKPNVAPNLPADEFALVLDDIRDPGNLGTIIRTADWYGIRHIIASEETSDLYNPKVIRSTMGSFCRVSVYYTSLTEFLAKAVVPVYGTFLGGADVHTLSFGKGGMIVVGNESNGISKPVEAFVSQKITIPSYGKAESLNASIATAVVLDNLRRR